MSKVEKNQGKKKVSMTNREKLWKQVNKKNMKVKYTLNPTSYDQSLLNEDSSSVLANELVEYEDDIKWSEIISEIDWSELRNNKIVEGDNDNSIDVDEI
jgi:hypothetical protein